MKNKHILFAASLGKCAGVLDNIPGLTSGLSAARLGAAAARPGLNMIDSVTPGRAARFENPAVELAPGTGGYSDTQRRGPTNDTNTTPTPPARLYSQPQQATGGGIDSNMYGRQGGPSPRPNTGAQPPQPPVTPGAPNTYGTTNATPTAQTSIPTIPQAATAPRTTPTRQTIPQPRVAAPRPTPPRATITPRRP